MNRPRFELTLALFTILLGACATKTEADSAARVPEQQQPEVVLASLEDRMIAASRVEFEFDIGSSGVVVSQLRGRVRWERDGELTIIADGMFVAQPQQLELRGDATTLRAFVDGTVRWAGDRPPELIDAVVLGLTHMGLLHNLAMLVGGQPPDHAAGGAREWLATDELELGAPETRYGIQMQKLEFVIVVSEKPMGRAKLWLDATGLPVERQQVVNFPEGEMYVVERYSNFHIET